ncbi:hypothetical protein ACTNEN_00655 [Oribacterium sp. HCP28S3_H8]|uniref:hypothetical protein n=1 Tax=Oribacterium sp. HCP28S3_H8 TaxID=3438945 RepID=UPI003F8CC355
MIITILKIIGLVLLVLLLLLILLLLLVLLLPIRYKLDGDFPAKKTGRQPYAEFHAGWLCSLLQVNGRLDHRGLSYKVMAAWKTITEVLPEEDPL